MKKAGKTRGTTRRWLPVTVVAVLITVVSLAAGNVASAQGTQVDPTYPNKPVELAPRGATVPTSGYAGSMQQIEGYLNFMVHDLDSEWTKYFASVGLAEPRVSYAVVLPGPGYRSNCGMTVVHDTPNAYYCGVDELVPGHLGTVYLPATTMQRMWDGDILGRRSAQAGDFAAAIITAHEFGHHVADEMFAQYYGPRGNGQPTGKNRELIADCFAGVWTASAYYQGLLKPGNFQSAVSALEAIGDTTQSSDPHGTAAERSTAMLAGYHGIRGVTQPGSPDTCVQRYWAAA